MRGWGAGSGLSVRVTAGTSSVLLGWDLADPAGCLGFGIHRTDRTEDEAYWLRGLKTFPSVVPHPGPGMDFSLRDHPLQGFQWGDYTAKPEHDYTYRVVAWGGAPGALAPLADVSVDVRTEAEDDGTHGIWFNRGVAGSQAYVKRFGTYTPPVGAGEDHPAFAWLSRGLGEAFTRFVGRASGPGWGLRGAFYEFTWATGLRALAAAATAGADVSLVVHGRDKDPAGGDDKDTTAEDNRAAVTAAGLDAAVIWRTAANRGALQHNKFLVLTHDGAPVAVWTGSTNLTQGAVFGHLNVGHLVGDPAVAGRFLDYWTRLADQQNTTAALRLWTEAENPVDVTAPGLSTVFSPRSTRSTLLSAYGDAMDGAVSSAHVTGAFGLNKVFRERLEVDRAVVRTVLLDQKAEPPLPATDPDVRVSWGDYLHRVTFEQWAAEHLTSFNSWVKFIHTKIILVDPLTAAPVTFTGSANYSDNSTSDNEENTVVVRGTGTPAGDAAARRVADIYLTEYQRLFMHFVFRDWAAAGAAGSTGVLAEDDSWSARYYTPGGWRARQRTTFAAPLP
ncbi:MAG TPA: phospholipase D-like domain-containing protein [Mycobacteriales bacterium]|nr:phospholipase D-like domain-containing protein [Mycobacteriales bacterium]